MAGFPDFRYLRNYTEYKIQRNIKKHRNQVCLTLMIPVVLLFITEEPCGVCLALIIYVVHVLLLLSLHKSKVREEDPQVTGPCYLHVSNTQIHLLYNNMLVTHRGTF